jgi:hypothetical protein
MSEQSVLTNDQLSKIQDLSSRLSQDRSFLVAVEKAFKDVQAGAPGAGNPALRAQSIDLGARLSRDPAFLTAVEAAFKVGLPTASAASLSTGTTGPASFGWSIPVADDDGHSSAAVMAAIAVAAAGALAEK